MCFRVFTRPLVSSHYMSVIPLPPTGTTKTVPDTSRCPLGGVGVGGIMLVENHWFREIQLLLQHHKASTTEDFKTQVGFINEE